jgi:AcrR family transcriptional regulator
MDPEVRKEQIMTAALKVFAERGFAEASNRDIAAEAGLNSPGLIYHYFPSKLDLLRAIVESRSPLKQVTDNTDWLLTQPPLVTLTKIGELYLSLYESPEAAQLLKVVFGEALRNKEFADAFVEIGPLRIVKLLINYFGLLMDQGVLRRVDPFTAVRSFLGPFAILFVFRTVFGPQEQFPVDPGSLVADNVQIFLQGLAVKSS